MEGREELLTEGYCKVEKANYYYDEIEHRGRNTRDKREGGSRKGATEGEIKGGRQITDENV